MYTKIFASMYDGTLATHGQWQALVCFQQLLVLADPGGIVDMTPEAIARRTTIPLEIITIGIATLEQPDPESRTPDQDGRRIVRLSGTRSWGWQIVNYRNYRAIRDEDGRREYFRLYQQQRRAAANGDVNNVNSVNNASNDVTKVNPSRSRSRNTKTNGRPWVAPSAAFEAFWQAMPAKRRVAKKVCAEMWAEKQLDAIAPEIMVHVVAMAASQDWRDGYNPRPLVYIDEERWRDGPPPAPPRRGPAL